MKKGFKTKGKMPVTSQKGNVVRFMGKIGKKDAAKIIKLSGGKKFKRL